MNSAATSFFHNTVASDSFYLNFTNISFSFLSRSNYGVISYKTIEDISSTLSYFFWIIFKDASLRFSYREVPEASSIKLRVYRGFILITWAILPCMTRKWGLLTFKCIPINIPLILSAISVFPFKVYLDLPSATYLQMITRSELTN